MSNLLRSLILTIYGWGWSFKHKNLEFFLDQYEGVFGKHFYLNQVPSFCLGLGLNFLKGRGTGRERDHYFLQHSYRRRTGRQNIIAGPSLLKIRCSLKVKGGNRILHRIMHPYKLPQHTAYLVRTKETQTKASKQQSKTWDAESNGNPLLFPKSKQPQTGETCEYCKILLNM